MHLKHFERSGDGHLAARILDAPTLTLTKCKSCNGRWTQCKRTVHSDRRRPDKSSFMRGPNGIEPQSVAFARMQNNGSSHTCDLNLRLAPFAALRFISQMQGLSLSGPNRGRFLSAYWPPLLRNHFGTAGRVEVGHLDGRWGGLTTRWAVPVAARHCNVH